MIHIVGAGPGAVDLITVRGQKLLSEADVVIYAGSLVSRDLLDWARQDARIYDSASMDLEQVMEVMEQAERDGLTTVRLHTGDPCLYGAIREQMDGLDARGIQYDICPGVSSFCGAAAALGMEYTLPGISQSVVITRMAGRTPVPERESIGKFAAHGSTMVIFLSAGMTGELSDELMKGGYPGDTPAAIVYKATWPDEKTVRCTVATLKETADREGIHKTALIVVGNTVAQTGYERSKLYDPAFTTGFRAGREDVPGKLEPGTLYVVGMGPGEKKQMTGQALEVMGRCQVIAGYTVYVDLVRGLFPQKEFLTTAMTREEERCRKAFECCMEGKNTAMICSGDAGVYGMAGLILELAQQYPGVRVRIVPGITAACAGAAVLGAPLMHDFAVISLSDRLTPLEDIWNRVEAAAKSDFVICLYNPASKGRPDFFRQACTRILKYRKGNTVCGLAVNIGREGEETEVLTLEKLKDRRVDMFTTVYIGNSHSMQIGSYMVTPRGTGMKENKKSVILFAGTTEGRLLAEYLQELDRPFVICVATGYGRDLLEDICRPDRTGCMEIRQGRLDVTEMEQMFDELRPELVIDATHPYAAEVTHNIKMACSRRKGLRLLRCLREPGAGDSRPGVIHMPDVEAAVTWLSSVKGNILVTTGSKELAAYTRIRDYGQRIYARILPSAEAVAQCRSLGFEGRHIIAMQGPFSEEMNLAQLREYGCAYLVTKDGGAAGGFPEKIKAAHRAGAAAVVIDRPGSGEGISLDEIKGQLKEWMDHERKGSIYG